MVIGYILFYVGVLLIASGKAVADTVADVTHWGQSIFSKFDIDGFFGCNDHTWNRKNRKNKFLNLLFTTILVWTTDIWHFAGMISRLGIYISICGIMLALGIEFKLAMVLILTYVTINIVTFHLLYTYGLKKNEMDDTTFRL